MTIFTEIVKWLVITFILVPLLYCGFNFIKDPIGEWGKICELTEGVRQKFISEEQRQLEEYSKLYAEYHMSFQYEEDLPSLSNLANGLKKFKEYEEAIEVFKKIITLTTNPPKDVLGRVDILNYIYHIKAYYGMGEALDSLKRYQEAIDAFSKVLAVSSPSKPLYLLTVQDTRKKAEKKIRELKKKQ
jgi:tetratricopeptide (TPR) repeat protein